MFDSNIFEGLQDEPTKTKFLFDIADIALPVKKIYFLCSSSQKIDSDTMLSKKLLITGINGYRIQEMPELLH